MILSHYVSIENLCLQKVIFFLESINKLTYCKYNIIIGLQYVSKGYIINVSQSKSPGMDKQKL